MRKARLKIPSSEKEAFYHCISRVVNRDFVFGDLEKEKFKELMRHHERLCQVQVMTYCLMSNHFHVLVRVPQRPAVMPSDADLIAHLQRCGVHPMTLGGVKYALAHLSEIGATEALEEVRQRWFSRMWDVSYFMKGLKQEFTQWFNRVHQRTGTLWESRFKSVLVEGSAEALQTMAAYIDLNPVRAGLVEDPKDYRWCGFAEAVAGGELAARGIVAMVEDRREREKERAGADGGEESDWLTEGIYRYRQLVFCGAESRGIGEDGRPMRRGVPRERIREVLEKKGKLSAAEMLRCRVRYFCDGAVLGSAGFVNEVFARERWRFGAKRKDGARKLRYVEAGGLRVLRDLRVRVV